MKKWALLTVGPYVLILLVLAEPIVYHDARTVTAPEMRPVKPFGVVGGWPLGVRPGWWATWRS